MREFRTSGSAGGPGQAIASVYPTGQVTFSGLFSGTGYQEGPGFLTDMASMTGPFSGGSDSWSDLTLDQPVAASQDAIYLVFAFPPGVPFVGRGAGGGPALGYLEGGAGTPGWISGDGETWMQLDDRFSFAVLPEFVPYEDGMLVKSLDGETEIVEVPVREAYLRAGPNPFNPKTELRFGLASAGHTTIEIFDVRGRRVTRLLDEHLSAGHHTVTWAGSDASGRGVASGVYLVRLSSGGVDLRQRLLLVR